MKTLEELKAMLESSPNDRTVEEISNELTITPEQAKELQAKFDKRKENKKPLSPEAQEKRRKRKEALSKYIEE